MVGIVRIAVILLLMAAYIAGYAWSAQHTDTADELMRAFEIRHALAFPMQGPPLGQVMHLGPVWFYLVAIPLWFRESWLAAALFVGFVCALKFPLAYWCGNRLLDARFGLLWAIALYAPGWSTFEQLVFLNPNAVATALLAILAVYLHAREHPTAASFAAMGLMLGLAAHVHPTAAPAAVFALLMFVRLRAERGPILTAILFFTLAFALPFLPYVANQVVNGFPDARAVSGYLEQQVVAKNALNAPAIMWNYLVAGPAVLAQYVLWRPESVASALGLANAGAAIVLMLVALVLGGPRARRLVVLFFVGFLVLAAWVGAMRPTTPLQFTWVLGPAVAGLVALGLWSLYERGLAGRGGARAWTVGLLGANIVCALALGRQVDRGEGDLPSRIMDIKGRLPQLEYRDVWFPAWAHDELGTLLCRAPRPMSLHGLLAYIVDKDVGLDPLLACHNRSSIALGASEARVHFVGMTQPFWKAASLEPDCRIGSLGIAVILSVPLQRTGVALAMGETYLPRRPSGGALQRLSYAFAVEGNEAVLVTNMLGGYEAFRVSAARIGDTIVQPALTNDVSELFVAPRQAPPGEWTIEVEASNPAGIDVAALPRGRVADSAKCRG